MPDTNSTALAVLVVLASVWRFARTRQLYLTSLDVYGRGLEPTRFRPRDLRGFVHGALLGRRSLKPTSFFVRGLAFAIVALCLLPFKGYQPQLVWLTIGLIALYVPWCMLHGVALRRASTGEDNK